MFRDRQAYEPGINNYVPAMQFSHAVLAHHPKAFSLGSPALGDNDLIALALPANSPVGTIAVANLVVKLDATYGRTLQYTVSADPGAVGGTIEVHGTDYLGQPMLERFAGVTGSVVPILGLKAFKTIKHFKTIIVSTNAVTWKIGTAAKLGLPYKGGLIWVKENNIHKAVADATASTQITQPDLTDPATATTGDPRGCFTASQALAGFEIVIGWIGDTWVNANNNGGLHGIRHYYA